MPRKKKSTETDQSWPKVVQGSHSTITTHEDGTTEIETNWTALAKDIDTAIAAYEKKQRGKNA